MESLLPTFSGLLFLAVKLGNIDFQKSIIQQLMMEKEVFFYPNLLIYFILILVQFLFT